MKRFGRRVTVILFALTLATPAAAMKDGNELWTLLSGQVQKNSEPGHAYQAGLAEGFVIRVTEVLTLTRRICNSAGVTNGQFLDITRRFLEMYSEHRSGNASVLVTTASKRNSPVRSDGSQS
jgi:hypothetical protein